MATLMEDYEGAGILGIEPYKKGVNMPQSRKEKLKAELQLLEWHKMANNAAIKGALLQTKSLRQASPSTMRSTVTAVKDDERWIKNVIQQEHLKPLEVSKDYVLDFERREKQNAEHLSGQVDRHISTLKSLRQRLESRHEMKTRSDEYRQWQRDFLPKKHAVLLGKTLDEIDTSPTTRGEDPDKDIDDELMVRTANKRATGSSNRGQQQELTTVLDSLSRLAELEQRISSLEAENRYDELVAKESPTANQRTAFEFRKKRGGGGQGPLGLTFEVRQKNEKSWKVDLPSGGGSAAARAIHTQEYTDDMDSSVERGPGVFITAQGSTDNLRVDRDAARRERLRNQALAPAGQKGLRARVQDRKARQKEQVMGAKKHESALREMARRKNDTDPSKRRGVGVGISGAAAARPRVQLAKKGISAGQHTKNKHLADFQNMKSGFKKRKEDLDRKMHAPVKAGIETRFVSQTAPAYSQPHPAAHPRPQPAAKKASTITTVRRTGLPVGSGAASAAQRRAAGAGGAVLTSKGPVPGIAVTGMGGLRVLKQQKASVGTRR